VGGRRGRLGVEETVEDVEGGDVGGVSVFTSQSLFAGPIFRYVAVAA
ncbi:hypothetical protein A2U01_0089189, partial [Trifolium medium]|nr:hypothetical protein [Trifolium medium]